MVSIIIRAMKKSILFLGCICIGALLVGVPFLLQDEQKEIIRDALPTDALQQIMLGIYKADRSISVPSHRVRAVVVPHHLTATQSIAAGIRMLTYSKPRVILVVSPDHFNECPTVICTTYGSFTTALGSVHTQDMVVKKLARSSLVTIHHTLFHKEHGIAAVNPYIKHYVPEATIVPIVLSQRIEWYPQRQVLLKTLQGVFDQVDAFVVSSDFSHYLTLTKADEMDEQTAQALFAADIEAIAAFNNPQQSDCPNCLWNLSVIAKNNDFYNPSVIAHTNSARLLQNESVQETTSHFAMAWYANDDLHGNDLAVAGDVTMTRTAKTPQLHPMMKQFWAGDGLRFVNLEGPLSFTCEADRSMFTFCNAAHLWNGMLKLATHWAVINNHMFDRYEEGFNETKKIIEDAKEVWVADRFVKADRVQFITTTALMNPVLDAHALDLGYSYRQVIDELKQSTATGVLTVVLVHAGKEYRALTSIKENEYLRSFIDAGADVVVAAHTHVLSDMEIYNNKLIFRGVGNFIFDQPDEVATSTAMAVRVRKENNRLLFETLRTRE